MSQNLDLDQTPSPSSPDVAEIGGEITLRTYARGDKIGGRYEVYQVITHGGMGDIYFCLDLEQDFPLALKTFKPQLIAKNPKIRDLFYQEVGVWVGLEKHPNIVRCYYLDYLDNLPFMVLEWIADPDRERTDLAEWLRKRGPLDLRLALDLTIDICRGLSYAVQKQPGLVHRDLKPANILITQDKTAKITDFGLATVAQQANLELTDLSFSSGESQSLLQLGSFVGTPAYAAPEHWDTPDKVDGRGDIYAIGCILYEMLTGKRPLEIDFKPGSPSEKSAWLENWRLAHEQRSLSLPGDWPTGLREIVQTCLQKEPGRRFASLEELIEDISRVYGEQFGEVPKTIEDSSDLTSADDYNAWGVTYDRIEQYERALSNYSKAIQLAPRFAIAYLNRGGTYNKLKRYEEALADYAQAIRFNPNLAHIYMNRGITYELLQRYEEALADYTYAIRLDPNSAQIYYNRGLIYQILRRDEDAIVDYTQTIRLDPNFAQAYTNLGVVYANLERYEDALANYAQAIHLDPNLVEAYINRAITYDLLQHYEESLTYYSQAIRLDPSNAYLYFSRGNSYKELHQYEEAIADYTQAIYFDSNDTQFYYNRGNTYRTVGRHQEAIADYTQAIRLDSGQAQVFNNRGLSYYDLQQYELALADFTQAIHLDPNLVQAYTNRGLLYANQQQYEDAFADFSHSIQLDPNIFQTYGNRGITYQTLQRYEDAIADYTRFIHLNPNDPQAYNNRGIAFTSLQRYGEAFADFTKVIELDPNLDQANSNLRSLEQLAFNALKGADSIDQMKQAALQFPFMTDDEFLGVLQMVIAITQKMSPNDKLSLEERLTWLYKIANGE